MTVPQEYYILAFPTTASAMEAESYLKKYFSISIMPVPREISEGCGLAIRFQSPDIDSITDFLKDSFLTCTLYRMETQKINGKHPIEALLSVTKKA